MVCYPERGEDVISFAVRSDAAEETRPPLFELSLGMGLCVILCVETAMKNTLLVAFAALWITPLGYAAPGGGISGVIKGADGAPFRAAFVRAQNVKTKMTMMVLSDNQGKYWTDKLPAGTYEVWATATGYKSDPARRADVTVQDGKAASVDFTMQKTAVQWSQLTKYQAGVLLPEAKGK